MHIDLEQEVPGVRHAAICIIGGGIAGLVLAQRLAAGGLEVTVLEAGGLTLEDRSQALYQAEMAAAHHSGSIDGRFRAFGGSSIRWGGQLLPYTPDTFAAWPIESDELEPYYVEIERLLEVGALPFDAKLLASLGHGAINFSSELRLRFSKWIRFGSRNLSQTIGRECLVHASIRIYTHANVASLEGVDGRIESARVLDYARREFEFRANRFIVCPGTIESARLLLASPVVRNEYDQIGRYFHDHLSFTAANVPLASRSLIFKKLGPFFVDGILHTCKLEATPAIRQRLGLLAVMAHLVIVEPDGSGVAAAKALVQSLQRGGIKSALKLNLLPLLVGLSDVIRLLWSSKVLRRRAISKHAAVRLHIDLEQQASPENRICLSVERDALGLPKALVDWRVSEAELRTGVVFAQMIEHEWTTAGLPSLEWLPGLLDGSVPPVMTDTYHAMGGLRMGENPTVSVVDRNLRVHGMANLYIASCAVFPSGGSSNPTFTLIALALRLADQLLAQ